MSDKSDRWRRNEAPSWLIAYIAVGIAVVGLLGVISYARTNRDIANNARDLAIETKRAQRDECVRVEVQKGVLRLVILGSVPSDKVGPGAAYYKEHPDELALAKRNAKKTLAAFALVPCPGLTRAELEKLVTLELEKIAAGKGRRSSGRARASPTVRAASRSRPPARSFNPPPTPRRPPASTKPPARAPRPGKPQPQAPAPAPTPPSSPPPAPPGPSPSPTPPKPHPLPEPAQEARERLCARLPSLPVCPNP